MSHAEPRRGPLPPVLFLLSLVAQGVSHLTLPVAQLIPEGWRLLGIVPVAVGMAVTAVADGRFKAVRTAVNPFGEPTTLVTAGPFRYSRNPMYVGMLMIMVGIAMLLGSLTPFLVPPVFAWVLSVRFIGMEEAKMERIFGDEYREYGRRVRRWI